MKNEILINELVNTKSTLVVVDMVNGFIREGALHDNGIERIISGIEDLIKIYLSHGKDVIFLKDAHTHLSKEFEKFPAHCLKGTKEADLIDEYIPYEKSGIAIEKDSTNANDEKLYRAYLRANKDNDSYLFTGCCTDICVTDGAIGTREFILENNLNTRIYIPEYLVETFDNENHKREEMNELGLKRMKKKGIIII